ncbi:response regulator [Haloferula sp. BvORR071]|uniref:response regulator n=1 Tax=Haloferula sp. BvORR071 TaxID=1396141 RepID=UPI00054E4293|nr:response regulator [Haloferula sp. BvORR071]
MKKPILLINDDEELVSQVTKVLKDGGYYYMTAATAKEALTQASGYDFALILLDLKLPDMDGDQLYGKLIESESHYVVPVVALVDSLDSQEVQVVNRLIPQGTVTLLSKPLKTEWLEDLFSRYGEKKG